MNNIEAPEVKRRILTDFFKGLRYVDISKKYEINLSSVKKVAEEITAEKFKPKDYLIIKVESKNMLNALDQLDRAGIKYDVPESFELIERYTSKL